MSQNSLISASSTPAGLQSDILESAERVIQIRLEDFCGGIYDWEWKLGRGLLGALVITTPPKNTRAAFWQGGVSKEESLGYARSKRSASMTQVQAEMKSLTNFSSESEQP